MATISSISLPITTTCTTTSVHSQLKINSLFPKFTNFDSKLSIHVQRICRLKFQRPYTKNSIPRISGSLLNVVEEGDKSEEEEDEECELVNGSEISIGDDGVDTINAYLLKAVKNNNGAGILLLSDIFGFEDSSTRDFAYRVACNGYNVLVPDLFCGDPWRKDWPKALLEEWIAKQSERVVKDIDTSAKWMADEFVAAGISKKLGIIGFCYGGGRVIDVLSKDHGAIFGTGVSFYGTRINTLAASKIKVPVLFITGDNDPLCQVSVLQDVKKSIGHSSEVVVFEGRGHGFAHRPGSLEEDKDAEQAFLLMRNWLQNGLDLKN